MSTSIGFVLVTHQNSAQIAFLCRRLCTIFPNVSIALHHDFGQSELDVSTLPEQVLVVKDWAPTVWGKYSLVGAYLKALRLLHRDISPDWTISISGSDYPIKSARQIMADLAGASADAFFDYRDISEDVGSSTPAPGRGAAFHTKQWLISAREKYVGFDVLPYRIRKHVGLPNKTYYVRNGLTTRFFTPFHDGFRPYAGDAWHTINRRAAGALLRQDKQTRMLQKFYSRRAIPDESYYHTVLLNESALKVVNDNRRYSIWLKGAPSPRWLTNPDVDDMVCSNAHFARKFPFDLDLYSAVDQAVLASDARTQ